MPVVDFIDYCLRGVCRVVFMNNPVTGLLILVGVGMYLGSSWLGVAGTLGLVVATLTALILGLDRGARRGPACTASTGSSSVLAWRRSWPGSSARPLSWPSLR